MSKTNFKRLRVQYNANIMFKLIVASCRVLTSNSSLDKYVGGVCQRQIRRNGLTAQHKVDSTL